MVFQIKLYPGIFTSIFTTSSVPWLVTGVFSTATLAAWRFSKSPATVSSCEGIKCGALSMICVSSKPTRRQKTGRLVSDALHFSHLESHSQLMVQRKSDIFQQITWTTTTQCWSQWVQLEIFQQRVPSSQSQVHHRLGRFQAQQATADHRGALRSRCARDDGVLRWRICFRSFCSLLLKKSQQIHRISQILQFYFQLVDRLKRLATWVLISTIFWCWELPSF